MKNVIKDNLLTSIAASSSDSNYPVTNLLDDHPKRIWKAASGVTQAVLTCSMSSAGAGAAGGIAIYGTNATRIVINIKDPNVFMWPDHDSWDGIEWPFTTPQTTPELDSSGSANAVWSEFDQADISLEFDIILSGVTTLEAGVVVAGEMLSFSDPLLDAIEGLGDKSIERDYSNSSFYYKKKDIVRTFNGVILAERNDDGFYKFMLDFARVYGKAPKAMRITSRGGFRWLVYARFKDMPSGAHNAKLSSINYQLIEVL